MKELIEKLRWAGAVGGNATYTQAADTIERLENELVAATLRIENDKLEFARIYRVLDAHAAITEKANAQAEEFERKWYLACDERDAYQQAADKMAAEHEAERDALQCGISVLQGLEAQALKERDAAQLELAQVTSSLTDQERLERENEALKLDAERYRWLRGNYDDSLVLYGDKSQCELMMDEELDNAIDAAMRGVK